MSRKGKEVVGASSSKRKRSGDGSNGRRNDQTGGAGGRKRKDRGVLRFFDDAADEAEDSDAGHECDEDSDFMGGDYTTDPQMNSEPAGISSLPVFPKEELMDEEEFDRMMEQRYKDGAGFVTYAGDDYEDKIIEMPSAKDPTIWKVKCMTGRERHSAFCLMQKFVHLKSLGNKLDIISAFSMNHVKGFIFIEAKKQSDINEACNGLPNIYFTRVQPVPINEVSRLLNTPSKCNKISEGMWARVKNGRYKGDLAQVVAVNDARRRATVKLIPRIDLQALAAKFGGGLNLQKNACPAPRLISSADLEKFRPLIQYRRDQDTGKYFEILDGMMLKEGYLYKKVPVDSLNFWGVEPNQEELLKFESPENDNADDLEWLSQLYGEQKKKRSMKSDKGAEKGEGTSGSTTGNGYDMHDLVCFNRKDFGVIVGLEKDDCYKILKDGRDGPEAVSVQRRDMKCGLFDLKLSALDKHGKTVLIDDTVKITEGVMEGKQGTVKRIYKGVVFINDENVVDNGGYLCCKSHMCEKIMLSAGVLPGKDDDPGPSYFDNFPVSPDSPASPKEQPQASENNRQFNNGEQDEPFSIGQTMRIKVGPLKGYLCRVVAIRRSGITVKLDSKQKVLTVQSEHLAEVQAKGIALSGSGNSLQDSVQQLGLFGSEAGSGGWNAEGTNKCHSGTEANDSGQGKEENPWSVKSVPNQNPSSWCSTVNVNNDAGSGADQGNGLGKGLEIWNTVPATKVVESGSSSWERSGDLAGSSKNTGDNWGKAQTEEHTAVRTSDSWNQRNSTDGNQSSGWGKKADDPDKSLSSGWNNSRWNKDSAETDREGDKKDQSLWDSKITVGGSKGAGGNWDTVHLEIADRQKLANGDKKDSAETDREGDKKDQSLWDSKITVGGSKGAGGNWDTVHLEIADRQKLANGDKKDSAETDREGDKKDQSLWDSKITVGGSKGAGGNWDTVHLEIADRQKLANGGTSDSWTQRKFADGNQTSKWVNKDDDPDNKLSSEWNNSGWNKRSSENDKEKQDKDQGSWGSKTNNGGTGNKWNCSTTVQESSVGGKHNSSWDSLKSGTNEKLVGHAAQASNEAGAPWEKKNSEPSEDIWEKASGQWGQQRPFGGNQDGNDSWNCGKNNPGSASGKGQSTGWGKVDSVAGKMDSDNSNWSSMSAPGYGDNNSNRTTWTSASDEKQNANWGTKNNWQSKDGNSGDLGGERENRNENWGSRPSGSNWTGGYGGGNDSERGGFRGRGRGGFGGSGRFDRGGFGGRSDRGGFGGRGGYERGASRGRGRGRNEEDSNSEGWKSNNGSGTWESDRNNSGKDSLSGWNRGEGGNSEGWRSNDGSGTWGSDKNAFGKDSSSGWNKGGGSSEGWKSSDGSGTWGSKKKDFGKDISSGWNKGEGASSGGWASKTGSGTWGSNRNDFGKDRSSGWNKGDECDDQSGTWNKGSERGGFAGGSERGSFSDKGQGRRDQCGEWSNRNNFGRNTSSGWNKEDSNSEVWKSNHVSRNQGSERGGFGGRGGSERGAFRGRGRGRRDQSGDWGNKNDFSLDTSSGWNKGEAGNSEEWVGWKISDATKVNEGSKVEDGWGKAPSSTATEGLGWCKGSGLTHNVKGSNDGDCWGKAPSSIINDGWSSKGSGNKELSVTEKTKVSNAEGCWGKSPSSSDTVDWKTKSSGQNEGYSVTEEVEGSNAESCWGVAPSSSASQGWACKGPELDKVTGVTEEAKGSEGGFEQEPLSGATTGDWNTHELGRNKESNSTEKFEVSNDEGGLEKGLDSSVDAGNLGSQGSECNKESGALNGGNVDKSLAWDQPNTSEIFASAWNQPEETIKSTVGDREATDA